MTISAYVGLPGHGKTYSVIEYVILPALKAGRTVYTNIPMNRDRCLELTGNEVVPFLTQDIIDNPNWWTEVFKPGSIFVMDEVWAVWPSGMKMNSARQQDKIFINEHRHLVSDGFSTEIILISQDLIDIATFVRNKIDTTFRVVKLTRIGSDNSFRLDVYEGYVTGQNPPSKQLSRQTFGHYKKSIFSLYTSQTKGDGSFGDESRTDNRFNILKGLSFKIIPIVIIVLISLSYCGLNKVKDFYTNPKSVKDTSDKSITVPPQNINSNIRPTINRKPKTLFDQIDKVFIASNNEILGLQLILQFGKSQSFISEKALIDNGIDIKILSDCFVLFFHDGYQLGKAMCQPDRPPTFANSISDQFSQELNL